MPDTECDISANSIQSFHVQAEIFNSFFLYDFLYIFQPVSINIKSWEGKIFVSLL